jgi:hypothetical protein
MNAGFGVVGLLFCVAGLLSVLAKNAAAAMTYISVGMMFVVLSLTLHH